MKPKVYLGWTGMKTFVHQIHELGWGRVWVSGQTAAMPRKRDHFFFDNGAYRCFIKDEVFSSARFHRDMERLPQHCDFGVLPDIVGGGSNSLSLSMSYVKDVRKDWKWLLCVQEGMTVDAVRDALPLVDGLFLGGATPAFKQTALAWSSLAKNADKLFHYGRCGTLDKLRYACFVNSDSLDSAFPLFTQERFRRFKEAWMQPKDRQADWIALSAEG